MLIVLGGLPGVGKTSIARACSRVVSATEAFLAPKIVVCEGATEAGLLRGFDDYWIARGRPSFAYRAYRCSTPTEPTRFGPLPSISDSLPMTLLPWLTRTPRMPHFDPVIEGRR